MKCQKGGGDVQYPKLHRGRRYCSEQCREAREKRERERQHREYLVGDECNCLQCAVR